MLRIGGRRLPRKEMFASLLALPPFGNPMYSSSRCRETSRAPGSNEPTSAPESKGSLLEHPSYFKGVDHVLLVFRESPV
jgi:hypothetical protein